MPDASLLFVNGTVLTMAEPSEAEALAVAGDRILAVGARADVERHRGPGTRLVDLRGRALLPGFVDAHTHLVQYGVRLLRLDLSRAASLDEALQMVVERAKLTPADGWVVGHSWDETRWPEGRAPTREELDRAGGGRRVILARIDRHSGVLSSAALEAVGATSADGVLKEDAWNRAAAAVDPAPATLLRGLAAAARQAHALGVTSAVVMASRKDHEALLEARAEGALGVRAACYFHLGDVEWAIAHGWRRGAGDAWVRVNGIKLYADGSLGSRTAAVSGGYAGAPAETGELLWSSRDLADVTRRAHAAGLQVAIHAIGDRAIDEALAAFEGVPREARSRVEHAELVTEPQARAMAERGVVASVQPNFTGEWGFRHQMYESRLGWARASRMNPFRRLADLGVPLAFGSDDMPFGPLYGLHHAVNGPTPEQSLDVPRALRAYTLGAAESAFLEREVGSLEAGKLADLVVLSADPRRAPGAIRDLRVEMTVLDGRVVHETDARQG